MRYFGFSRLVYMTDIAKGLSQNAFYIEAFVL